jgi:SagB-type dehydrogenase family enzyme
MMVSTPRSLVAGLGLLLLGSSTRGQEAGSAVSLPAPSLTGEVSVEAALQSRRSVRQFSKAPIGLEEIGQLLWSAQGITSERGFRTTPSAGALFPLELYVVAENVVNLPEGVYRYRPERHELEQVETGAHAAALTSAALSQSWVGDAPAVVVLAGVYGRTARKYGSRAERYVHIEVGCASQGIYLQAQALGLATTLVGAFYDERVLDVLGAEPDHSPLGLMPVGWPR